jgi:hypothetical protein
MYKRILAEVKPTEISSKMTYANTFHPDFCLLLRERRATSLAHMQDASLEVEAHMQDAVLEVESNILAADKLRGKDDRDKGKGRSKTLTYSSFVSPPQTDETTKLLKSLSTRMKKIELEGKQNYRNPQNVDNRGNYRRPNNTPQIIQRDQRSRDKDDQKIHTPLQNNIVVDEEEGDEDPDPEIHYLGDTSSFPHLT